MEKVRPREIRIVIDGGLVQKVGIGKEVSRDLRIIITDFDFVVSSAERHRGPDPG